MKTGEKTNVMRTLEQKKMAYTGHFYEEDSSLTGVEIAEKLGMSRSGVAAMLKRTRSKLKTYLMMEGLCTIRNE